MIQACQEALNNIAGQWPEGLFKPELYLEDLGFLRKEVLGKK